MIKLIIFDLGGILVPEKKPEILEYVAKEIGCTKEQLEENLKEYDEALTKGEITLKEFYRKLLKRCNIEKNPEEIVKKHVEEYTRTSTQRSEDIINIIEELKINYEVVALTNTEIEIGNYNREHGLFKYFEKAFLSTEMHMKKPDAMIFQKVLDDRNVAADEAVFIDDKEENTEGARELGIPCILYENPKQLKKMLEIIL